jgi:hypothetical protein
MPGTWTADGSLPTADAGNFTADGSGPGFAVYRVQAVSVGDYGGITRNIGDVFDIYSAADFSDSTVDYLAGGEGSPLYGWMIKVSSTQALVANSPTPLNNPAYNGAQSYMPTTGSYPRLVF